MLFFATFLLVFSLSLPVHAADPGVDQAYTSMELENWDEADRLIAQALTDATTDVDKFDAREALATLNYYTLDSAEVLPDLIALDAEAVQLFGPVNQRRIPVLELLGLTYDYLQNNAEARRQFTKLIRIAHLTEAEPETLLFAKLNLANLLLDDGRLRAAAMLAAELSISATEAFGPENEITFEAAVIRASAHFRLGHMVETVVHAMPLLNADYDALIENYPDVADRYAKLHEELLDQAARSDDPDATAERWYTEAQTLIAQRDAVATSEGEDLDAFGAAIYGKDPARADAIARKLTASVLADDPFPAAFYHLMVLAHLTSGEVPDAVPWVKRFAEMPAEYLATHGFDLQQPLADVVNWLAEQGRLPEALEINALSLSLTGIGEDPNAPSVQELRLERSGLLALARDYKGAMAETERALAENDLYKPAVPLLRSRILAELGQLTIELQDYQSAEAHLSKAVALLQSSDHMDDMHWAETLTAYGNSLSAMGRDEDAIAILEKSLTERIRLTGETSSATVTGQVTLAAALAKNGQNEAAAAIYDRALTAFRDHSDASNPLFVTLTLGYADLLERSGQTTAAERLFDEAADMSAQTLNSSQPFDVISYQQLANRALAQDRLEDAETYLASAQSRLSDADPALTDIRIKQGHVALRKGELDLALQMFRDAKDRLSQPGQGQASHARDYLPAYIETLDRLARTDGADADAYLDEIFLVAQSVNELSAGRALGRAALRWTSEPELAENLRRLQDIEASVTKLRGDFRDRVASNAAAIDIQTQLDKELAAARQMRDEIDTAFPDYSRFAQGKAIDLKTVAGKLHADEVMVLFATSPDDATTGDSGSIVLALTKEALRVNATANRDALERLAHDLRCAAALTDTRCGRTTGLTRGAFSIDGDPDEDRDAFDTSLAHQAYQTLLGPVADALEGKTRLIVVPDQSLAAMPFHLLVKDAPQTGSDIRDAAWLIRDMSVVVVPTVASFDALRGRDRRTEGEGFLGIGDPLIGDQIDGPKPFDCALPPRDALLAAALDANGTGSFQRGGGYDAKALTRLAALPDTRCELQHAAGLIGGNSRLLLQADATESQIKKLNDSGELAKYRYISFATHGLIAGEVGAFDAGLVLTPPRRPDTQDDGLLTTGEIAQLQLDADFIFLSACNTAAGTAENDEGLSGLASAFFYAGARSLLVSHWPVYSDAASRLTSDMVTRLSADPALGLSDALRHAMLDVLDDPDSDDRMRHPAYWGPFMIVGEGATLGAAD